MVTAGVLGAAGAEQAFAGAEVCTPCVMVIEVDGLEAKDITPQTTPFLWTLAHSGTNGGNAPGDATANATTIGAAGTPGFAGRNGFQWAAARGVMTSMTAASTMSLMTGGYVDQNDVFADEYLTEGNHRLLGGADDESPTAPVQMVDELVNEGDSGVARAWIGDPRLFGLFTGGDKEVLFTPTQSDSVPAYCYVPENGTTASEQGPTMTCPTADLQVVNKAQADLTNELTTGKATLAYLYLAELGAIKRLHGDFDTTVDPSAASGQSLGDAQAVAHQLTQTDAAIGALLNAYQQKMSEKWANTVLMVVGNHGYELTPTGHRVLDPETDNPPNPGMGLSEYVARVGRRNNATATFIPSGTMGTIYITGAGHDATLAELAAAFAPGGKVDKQTVCQATSLPAGTATLPAGTAAPTGCIAELLATGAVDSAGHSTVPDQGDYKVKSAQDEHPSWRLHYVKDGKATGSDGDLLVVMKSGWAAGTLTPVRNNDLGTPDPISQGNEGEITNPYFGSPGGPRNRAIAAIINGPSTVVRQVVTSPVGSAYPVSSVTQAAAADDNTCPTVPSGYNAASGNPNLTPGDDANIVGHECQAETVDFAPTIAALLKVSVPDSQLGGRFLQEAFARPLSAVRGEEEILNISPDDPPPPPEPDVEIPDPPKQKPGFTYAGLLRRLQATVVDKDGCTWATARPGAKLDYLRIEGDFGKALSSTTLTFYRRSAARAATTAVKSSARHRRGLVSARAAARNKCLSPKGKKSSAHKAQQSPPLKAIARFAAFALKRGHVRLRLAIPELYRPTHIGVFVQEARRLAVPKVQPDGKPGLTFEAFGPATGAIVSLVDGDHLHEVKPKSSKRRHARKTGRKRHAKADRK